ncbi:MAG: hypothetical protein AB1846_12015 [Chloroflexota bacterium]
MPPVISVEHLSKTCHLGQVSAGSRYEREERPLYSTIGSTWRIGKVSIRAERAPALLDHRLNRRIGTGTLRQPFDGTQGNAQCSVFTSVSIS